MITVGMSLHDHAVALAGRAAASVAVGPRLSILIFHRVLREPDPIFPGELDAARFERLMAVVARTFRVLPLDQAVSLLASDQLPSRALSITFDDGYADNHDVAMPILQRLGINATFFVATGFIDGGCMWNDTVIECLRGTRADGLDLTDFGLSLLPTASARERRVVIDRLLPLVKYQVPEMREPMLQRLHEICGRPKLPGKLMMGADELRALCRAGMLLGAHTVRHPILCTLPDHAAEVEIAASRAQLEAVIDKPVALFAYPNGQPGVDFDDRHVAMARRLGFAAAVSTLQGVSRPGDDLFRLRRYTPWDADTLRWTARLVARHILS